MSASWETISAEEYCLSVRDGTHDSPKFHDAGYPLITSKAIKNGSLQLENAGLISEVDYVDINKRSKVDQWDILFTMIGTLGEVYLEKSEEIGYAIKNVGLFKCGDELKAKWLYYWFKSPVNLRAILALRRGASQQYLPLGTLRGLQITYPKDPMVANKIIDLVSSYDGLIENNRRRIQLLEESARLLYKEWFVHLRFPGHEHVKIKDGVPQGWEMVAAYDVMDVLSGGTPKTKVANYWDGEIPFFTPKDTTGNAFVYKTEKYLTEEGLAKCNSKLYPKYTLFITARGTVGKLCFAQQSMAMNQSCYALVGKEGISQQFLYCALVASIEQFKARAGGAVFDAIVVDTFKRIPFLKPSDILLQQFHEFAEDVFNQVDVLVSTNRKLAEARDILLPRLMSGDLAV